MPEFRILFFFALCLTLVNTAIYSTASIHTELLTAKKKQPSMTLKESKRFIISCCPQSFCDLFPALKALQKLCDKIESGSACNAIPISNTGSTFTISQPGCYCLTEDISLDSGSIINITTSHVTIDLNCHTLDQLNSDNNAINASGQDFITIKNGTISNTTSSGISIVQAKLVTVKNVEVTNTNLAVNFANIDGFKIQCVTAGGDGDTSGGGIAVLNGTGGLITNCILSNPPLANMNDGISLSDSNNIIVRNCIITDVTAEPPNGFKGISISNGETICIEGCLIAKITGGSSDSDGIFIDNSRTISIVDCKFSDCDGNGIDLESSTQGVLIQNCLFDQLDRESIRANSTRNITIEQCNFTFCDDNGISLNNTLQSMIVNCNIQNCDNDGINVNTSCDNCQVLNTIATSNNGTGIRVSGSDNCQVLNCIATNNDGEGIVLFGNNSQIINNKSIGNESIGIDASGDNRIQVRNNTATNNDTGIDGGDNKVYNNFANNNNTTNYENVSTSNPDLVRTPDEMNKNKHSDFIANTQN